MIFSLLNIRKKTAAALSGIAIAIGCLWGMSIWQDIGRQEMLQMLLASVLMLGSIIVAALLLIVVFKLIANLFSRFSESNSEDDNS